MLVPRSATYFLLSINRTDIGIPSISTPSSTTYSEATSPQTIDTTTEHSPEGEWEEVVSKKTRKKLSLSPKKVTPTKNERPIVASPQQRRKTPTPPPPKMQRTKSPERQSVKAQEKTAHEKIISAPGRPEWPLHEKYDLDEVVTDKLPDGPQYIIIRAYRQQREGEEFNVDRPAYFCRFLNDAKYYFFKGPMSKYFHEANYTDIEGRFKRGKAVSNRILWYDNLSNASVGKEGTGGRYIAKQTAAGLSVWLPGPFQGRGASVRLHFALVIHTFWSPFLLTVRSKLCNLQTLTFMHIVRSGEVSCAWIMHGHRFKPRSR